MGKTVFQELESLHMCTSAPMQRECQLLGPAAPLSLERAPLILHQLVPTFSHLSIRMTCLTEHHYYLQDQDDLKPTVT